MRRCKMYILHKIYKNNDSSSKCTFKNVFSLKRSICIKLQWKSHGSFSTAPLTDVSQLMKRLIEGIALTQVINMHVLIQLLTRIDLKKKIHFSWRMAEETSMGLNQSAVNWEALSALLALSGFMFSSGRMLILHVSVILGQRSMKKNEN